MITTLLPFLVILALAWIWLSAARAREFATILARSHCERHGLQFLDDTVAPVRFGVRWTADGLRLRRMFRFEFSLEGVGRRIGYVLMLGTRLEAIDDGLMKESDRPSVEVVRAETQTTAPVADNERKVIPFRRKDR
jgi:hypothetical protein